MNSENNSGRHSRETKGNSNLGFFTGVITFGLAATLLVVYLVNVRSIEIKYTNLLTLIEYGEVVVNRDQEKNRETYLTHLTDVEVGAFAVTGKVASYIRNITEDDTRRLRAVAADESQGLEKPKLYEVVQPREPTLAGSVI